MKDTEMSKHLPNSYPTHLAPRNLRYCSAQQNVSIGNGTQQSVTIDEILTIQESTLDGSGEPGRIVPGNFNDQVEVYFGLSASTPDKDGSEKDQ